MGTPNAPTGHPERADWAPRAGRAVTVEAAVKVKAGSTVLHGVTFSARPGQVTALLGPNGAGKTTVLRSIVGLERLTGGAVGIGGTRLADHPFPARVVGAVLDVDAYSPVRSAADQLALTATASGLPPGAVDRALRLVGLSEHGSDRIGRMSLGMRQRLALAAALIGEPDVLVLDEPHNGLDAGAIRWLREVLLRYARSGRTVLLSTHLLSEVAALADRIVVLVDGGVAVDAPAHEWAADRHDLEARYLATVGEW
ncbi:ATP-binding cassette domain-containing protein [Gordonia sp. X0973]|nr:ATP-binding cassette domain-containing protein [Gordonia sp. X0973]